MGKWFGIIGYAEEIETSPGVWENVITERKYYGDVIKNNRRLQGSNKLNDDIVTSNDISIIADPFANNNFHCMHYIEFMGTKWSITNVDVQYPRLILSLGGIYNGEQA